MFRYLLLASSLALAVAPVAHATDLWQVWQLAEQNDPAFKQALADRNASMEAKPAAWANLFPSINLSASRTWDNGTGDSLSFFGSQIVPVKHASNDREDQWGAQLTQTIFNWQQYKAVQGADFTVAQAEATYEAALQGLIVSVSQAYFGVLNARDVLGADLANQKALFKQFQQTQEQFKVGLIAITGVRQAEAAFEQARAQVIADRQALSQAEEVLRAITGQYLTSLEEPQSSLPLHPPQPEDVNTWVTQGMKQNPALIAAQFGSRVAENLVSQQEGGYMPSLNLVLQHLRSTTTGNSSYFTGGQQSIQSPDLAHSSDNQIGLQLSWNIFSGGATRAATQKAQFQADSAMDQEISQRRSIEQQVRNAYLAVLSGIAQVQATKQSVAASQVALEATEAGLKVGTQTVLDVLQSRSTFLTAEKSYFIARYNYLLAILALKQAAGSLSPQDVKQLNTLLVPTGAPNALSVALPTSAPFALTVPKALGTPNN